MSPFDKEQPLTTNSSCQQNKFCLAHIGPISSAFCPNLMQTYVTQRPISTQLSMQSEIFCDLKITNISVICKTILSLIQSEAICIMKHPFYFLKKYKKKIVHVLPLKDESVESIESTFHRNIEFRSSSSSQIVHDYFFLNFSKASKASSFL